MVYISQPACTQDTESPLAMTSSTVPSASAHRDSVSVVSRSNTSTYITNIHTLGYMYTWVGRWLGIHCTTRHPVGTYLSEICHQDV